MAILETSAAGSVDEVEGLIANALDAPLHRRERRAIYAAADRYGLPVDTGARLEKEVTADDDHVAAHRGANRCVPADNDERVRDLGPAGQHQTPCGVRDHHVVRARQCAPQRDRGLRLPGTVDLEIALPVGSRRDAYESERETPGCELHPAIARKFDSIAF